MSMKMAWMLAILHSMGSSLRVVILDERTAQTWPDVVRARNGLIAPMSLLLSIDIDPILNFVLVADFSHVTGTSHV
jgi:hypothetical protein